MQIIRYIRERGNSKSLTIPKTHLEFLKVNKNYPVLIEDGIDNEGEFLILRKAKNKKLGATNDPQTTN